VADVLRPRGAGGHLLPRRRQTIEKRAEIFAGARRRLVAAVAYGQQLLLRVPNRLEQSYRVECDELPAQLFFDALVNPRRGQQALTGGERQMIAPPEQRTVALFAGQFEGGLEKVHVQASALVQASERRGGLN